MNSTENYPFVLICNHVICKKCKINLQQKSETDDGFYIVKCQIEGCNKNSEINEHLCDQNIDKITEIYK